MRESAESQTIQLELCGTRYFYYPLTRVDFTPPQPQTRAEHPMRATREWNDMGNSTVRNVTLVGLLYNVLTREMKLNEHLILRMIPAKLLD